MNNLDELKIKKLSTFNDQWISAYERQDYEQLLRLFIHQTSEYITTGDQEGALFYLWLSLSCTEYVDNDDVLIELMHISCELSFYLHTDESFAFLLETLVAKNYKRNPKIIASVYFILSVIAQNKFSQKEAYMYAKLSLFFAETLADEDREFYVWRGNLQFAFTKDQLSTEHILEGILNVDEWAMGFPKILCKQVLHFIESIKINEYNIAQLRDFLLLQKNEPKQFYSNYLFAQLIYNMRQSNAVPLIQLVNQLVDDTALVNDVATDTREVYVLLKRKVKFHSELFFEEAQRLYEQVAEKQNTLVILEIHSSPNQFANIIDFLIDDLFKDYIVFSYKHEKLLFVMSNEIKQSFIKKFVSKFESHTILNEWQSLEEHRRFTDFFNAIT